MVKNYRNKSSIKSEGVGVLGSPTPDQPASMYVQPSYNGAFIEITLNYPRTASFLKLDTDRQKTLYNEIWNDVIGRYSLRDDFYSKKVYEHCQTGAIHLHGYFRMSSPCYPIGLVTDVVKYFLKCMPKYKNANKFSEANVSKFYCRYESPSVTVTYRSPDNKEDQDRWEHYLNKEQMLHKVPSYDVFE